MNLRKLMAGTLAMTMVAGSSMVVLAEDANSATGSGSSFDHVNKEVTSVTLPTTSDVANVFNYYVDPERVINDAKKLADGNSATTVDPNTDGVYFAHKGSAAVPAEVTAFSINGKDENDTTITVTVPADTTVNKLTFDGTDWKDDEGNTVSGVTVSGETAVANDTITITAGTPAGNPTYSSSSEAVNFEGQNSVDVDVSVAATVTASADGKDIALVADDAALTAATTPALLMTLKVGSESKAITSEGTSAKATLAGKPNNFAVTVDENNKYTYGVRENTDETALDDWASTTVQLVGKTNQKDIPTGANAMTAPTINLTWTIGKHETTPPAPTYTDAEAYGNWAGDGSLWLAKDSSNGFSSSTLTVEVSDGGTTYTALASDKYSVSDANWVSVTWDNMVEALGSNPSGNIFIRVTDGTTRYTFENR